MTAEIARLLSEAEARKLTERIRITAHNYTEAKAKLLTLVQEAKDGSAHEVLGYKSWTAYLTEVFDDEPLRLARDDRQDMAQVLSAEGMSTRAIGSIVGASHMTVSNDLSGVKNFTPEPGVPQFDPDPIITGRDGKTYTKTHQPKPEPVVLETGPRPEPNKEVELVNDIREQLNFIGTSTATTNLSPKAKQFIIEAANKMIANLQRS